MWEYNYDYICHANNYKYIDRKWDARKGGWVYTYPEDVNRKKEIKDSKLITKIKEISKKNKEKTKLNFDKMKNAMKKSNRTIDQKIEEDKKKQENVKAGFKKVEEKTKPIKEEREQKYNDAKEQKERIKEYKRQAANAKQAERERRASTIVQDNQNFREREIKKAQQRETQRQTAKKVEAERKQAGTFDEKRYKEVRGTIPYSLEAQQKHAKQAERERRASTIVQDNQNFREREIRNSVKATYKYRRLNKPKENKLINAWEDIKKEQKKKKIKGLNRYLYDKYSYKLL